MTARTKHEDLKKIIKDHGPVLVAYSGGVDSTLLAATAKDALGEKTRCVLLDSPVVPRAAVAQAQEIARGLGLGLDIIEIPLMSNADFRMNPFDRCYYCKKISAVHLKKRAGELGLACIADGTNISDTGEHRPGLRASTEEGILHPFIEAGLTKQDIRNIARMLDLPVWQKPSAACLASRIPYGDAITAGKLQRIEDAEAYLAGLNIGQLRVRMHGDIARIEVHKEDLRKILDKKTAVAGKFRSLGFAYVTLDLEGYRSGSMDEVLK
ncbi:MAG: ATP-dependent sacrificial sulfur transferase LarE [Methanoregula sp.]|nr:ATP-dependent sacrificial sulfur transferase LarE [Methanoregula sp.]